MGIGSERPLRRSAFTLIELSIAVFIMALLMAVSAPYFVRSYNSSLLSSAARAFITTCQYARLQAVMQQRESLLHVDLDRQLFWISQPPQNTEGDAEPQVLKSVEISPRIALASVELADEAPQQKGQVQIKFYPNGTCEYMQVVFHGTEKGSGLTVEVDPVTGRATTVAGKL